MAFGLGVLRLSPRDFWNMTLIEIEDATGWSRANHARPSRLRLGEMMSIFPDRNRRAGNE